MKIVNDEQGSVKQNELTDGEVLAIKRAAAEWDIHASDSHNFYRDLRCVNVPVAAELGRESSDFYSATAWWAWFADNKAAAKELSHRARKSRGEVLKSKTRIEVLFKYRGRCYVCGIEEWRYQKRLHMHRVTPGTAGGLYTLDNVIPLCSPCHRNHEGKAWEEMKPLRHPETIEVAG